MTADSLETLVTALHVDVQYADNWRGEEKIKNVRNYDLFLRDALQENLVKPKPGRPRKYPPLPPDPSRHDAQILLAYHAGLSRDQIAVAAGCTPIWVLRRIFYHYG